jgi:RNA polymerase sigma-70 factor (ECF subfamily)
MSTLPVRRQETRATEELLAAARGGCGEALGTLLQSFRTYLVVIGERELRADLRVKVSPSDLVQETFAEGQRCLHGFAGTSTQEFQAWLRAILLNRLAAARKRYLIAEARQLSREDPSPDRSTIDGETDRPVDEETPSKHAMRQEDAHTVRQAIAQLPEHYRQVIQLRNFDVLPFAQIALIMQRPEQNLRALWIRAMQRLKEELNGFDAPE